MKRDFGFNHPTFFVHSLRFHFQHNCDENGDEFGGFVAEWFEFLLSFIAAVDQQFQPIIAFVQFLQSTFDFADEIGVRFGSTGLAVLRSGRGAGAQ